MCAAHGHGMADPYVYWIKGLGPGFGKISAQLIFLFISNLTLLVAWVKREVYLRISITENIHCFSEEKGKHMGPVAVGKSTLFIEKVTEEDIDTYRFNFVPNVKT